VNEVDVADSSPDEMVLSAVIALVFFSLRPSVLRAVFDDASCVRLLTSPRPEDRGSSRGSLPATRSASRRRPG
jgi:hypothetical protein